MAALNETSVGVNVTLRRNNGVDSVFLTAQSYTTPAGGGREAVDFDVTTLLDANLRANATALLDAAVAYVKQQWQIP